MAATIVCIPRVSSNCLLPLWGGVPDQQVGLTQAPFKLLHLPEVLECVSFCVSPFKVESPFPTSLWFS